MRIQLLNSIYECLKAHYGASTCGRHSSSLLRSGKLAPLGDSIATKRLKLSNGGTYTSASSNYWSSYYPGFFNTVINKIITSAEI